MSSLEISKIDPSLLTPRKGFLNLMPSKNIISSMSFGNCMCKWRKQLSSDLVWQAAPTSFLNIKHLGKHRKTKHLLTHAARLHWKIKINSSCSLLNIRAKLLSLDCPLWDSPLGETRLRLFRIAAAGCRPRGGGTWPKVNGLISIVVTCSKCTCRDWLHNSKHFETTWVTTLLN